MSKKLSSNISDFVISQYYDSPNLKGILDLFERILNDNISDATDYLKPETGLQASGYWLELLARRFGLERPLLPDGDDSVYFGLVTSGASLTNKGTFSQAPFVGDGQGGVAGKIPLSDAMFRLLIRMVASKLKTSGTQDATAEIISNLYKGSFVIDNQDMTTTYWIKYAGSENDINTILGNLKLFPKPAGVAMDYVAWNNFGFDGTGTGFSDDDVVPTWEGPFA